jgi:flagellar assembly protein FliH
MREKSKFLFENSFDGRTGERARRADGRPIPTRTEEELEAARQESYAAGHAAGAAEVRVQVDTIAAQALTIIGSGLSTLGEAQGKAIEEMRRKSVELAYAVAVKLAPALMRRYPLEEIEALVLQCLAELHDEPRIVVRASDPVIAAMKSRVADMATSSRFDGQVVLIPDDTMQAADCRVEWVDGGVERNGAALSQRISAAVERFLEGRTI